MRNSYQSIVQAISPVRPWMSQVTAGTARSDALAGFTNAAIVLPQGVAFAVIAGLPPEYGLFTAMIAPVIAGIWGASMVMVSGPTVAISAVVFASLSPLAEPGTAEYVSLALILTIAAGLFQLVAGALRLGALIAFISPSVMVGFTAAAALMIGVSQLGSALGVETSGGGIILQLQSLAVNIGQFEPLALAISVGTIASLVLTQMISKRIPAYLIALVIGALAGAVFEAREAGIEMFSTLSSVVPRFDPPALSTLQISEALPGAATVAFVGLMSAISIGRSFAMRRRERYDANQEIVGQGLANSIGGLFQSFAASGSFTRSALNADSGARTPLSAIFSSGFLVMLLLVIAPLMNHIPVPAMAGIIIYVAWRLVDLAEIRHIMRNALSETLILSLTFLSGILTKLDIGIVVGVTVSLVVFLNRSAHPHLAVMTPAIYKGQRSMRGALYYGLQSCPQINFLRLEGPLFFASMEHVEHEFRRTEKQFPGRKFRILSLKGMGRMDLAGADLLAQEIHDTRAAGGDFHIVAAHFTIVRALKNMHLGRQLGFENLHPSKGHAIAATVAQVDPEICRTCKVRAFTECAGKPAPEGVAPDCEPPIVKDVYIERSDW